MTGTLHEEVIMPYTLMRWSSVNFGEVDIMILEHFKHVTESAGLAMVNGEHNVRPVVASGSIR
jgi:hypothetical protein